jgi:probable F420-dependent oxidoreductase
VPSAADWLDPLDLLAFLSATTSTIRLATGILLLPEHNPVVVAKRAATVDVLSGGRLMLGVGIGWSAEEFAALGVPFHGRGTRAEEYIDVLRALWRDDVASHTGSHVQFDRVRSYPKPIRRVIPVVLGGNSDGALERVARCADGWYGFNLSLETLPERLGFLRSACLERGRPASGLDIAVALIGASATDLPELEALGVSEIVLVEAPPPDARDAADWVEGLARTWRVTA